MQVNRQRKYLSRSYINEFMFGYDISPSFLLIGTAILLVGISFLQLQPIIAQVQPSEANLTSTEQQHLLDGISFQIDNVTFSHHTATVNGIQLHYVTGGHGDPVVLLHGWPETWYSWHRVMPALAKLAKLALGGDIYPALESFVL